MKLTGKRLALLLLVLYLGACVTLKMTMAPETTLADRGLLFPHPPHAEALECDLCHDFETDEPFVFDHAFCSNCHEITEDQPTEENCSFCHTREDYSVTPRERVLMADVKFEHPPHAAQEIACETCHPNPDTQPYVDQPAKPFCMDCHGSVRPELNECSVCHIELNEDVIPKFRHGNRIAHDAPDVWEQVHGRESRIDPVFCAQCHDQEADCQHCHEVTKPDNHTVAWRRRTHGLIATWDRQNCMMCHEETSCLQCHQNTQPASHRGRFGSPVNAHCVQCHFPEDSTNCTVCHEEIAHRSAGFSPHLLGIYPPDCARCHPGGIPTRAPHLMNSSVRCTVCHF